MPTRGSVKNHRRHISCVQVPLSWLQPIQLFKKLIEGLLAFAEDGHIAAPTPSHKHADISMAFEVLAGDPSIISHDQMARNR